MTLANPVDYWNLNHSWQDSFYGTSPELWENPDTFRDSPETTNLRFRSGLLYCQGQNPFDLKAGSGPYTKFQMLAKTRFSGNCTAAMTFISHQYLEPDIPYIRVGTDYLKVIDKQDRYGINRKILKGWKKDEIKQDHGPDMLKRLHRFDDFCIVPDNFDHNQIVGNCYNLYSPFAHQPYHNQVTLKDIPASHDMMRHIFGDQLDNSITGRALGWIYMQVLYLHPTAVLPVLCPISTLRETGKTTFLNWIQMIFGDNYVQINPEDLSSPFNSGYAPKNIIAVDETIIDKSHVGEKIKSMATAKTISVNQKFVANSSLPFFGKLILCTNKEKDFMRIDEEEVRFWIRKIKTPKNKNTRFETLLRDEIPMFLKYLLQLPPVDFSSSRMVFTASELRNSNLDIIKQESWSNLRKELIMYISDHFLQNESLETFQATAKDIKDIWFKRDQSIKGPYILKVLIDEMGMTMTEKVTRYRPINGTEVEKKPGTPFTFNRADYAEYAGPAVPKEDIPF